MILEFRSRGGEVHTIHVDGVEVGDIVDNGEDGSWKVRERYTYDHRAPRWDIGRYLFPSLKEAKRHIAKNIKKAYPATSSSSPQAQTWPLSPASSGSSRSG